MKIVKRKGKDQRVMPYRPMRSILDEFFAMPSFFEEEFGKSLISRDLFVDVWEEDDNFFIKMAMPGVNKDDVKIDISNDLVTIKGQGKTEEEKDDKKRYYYKALESSFEQTFNLPSRVDAEKADAKYEDGVLTLTLPKTEEEKPKRVEVK